MCTPGPPHRGAHIRRLSQPQTKCTGKNRPQGPQSKKLDVLLCQLKTLLRDLTLSASGCRGAHTAGARSNTDGRSRRSISPGALGSAIPGVVPTGTEDSRAAEL